MHLFFVGLLAATALSDARTTEPSENAMREAFSSDLADGVRSVLTYVEQIGGARALTRIRNARTDTFAITAFRKVACRPDAGQASHRCVFEVEIDTVAGPLARSIGGRFFIGPCGLAYDHGA